MLAMFRLEMTDRFEMNHSIRFLNPGNFLIVDGSSVRVAKSGISPTRLRTGSCFTSSGPYTIASK